jgi:antitoxin (DNA-binding transcriptional repressor) of toxin-antitoxin stability system
MFNISVEKMNDTPFIVSPMSIKRDWMDATSENHAYRCFPVTQANVVGWSISCKEDISFFWDGINDQTDNHVEIFSPMNAYTGRGQSSISLKTGLIFRTDEDVSIITINPVNYFNEDFETMSNLISTSFFDNPLPLVIKAKKANRKVVIKAGTPIATIIPISLKSLQNTSINIFNYSDPEQKREKAAESYGIKAQEFNRDGKWTDWYRDAVNEKNETLGSHEVKALKLYVKDNTQEGTQILGL